MRILLFSILLISFSSLTAQTTISFEEEGSNNLYIKLYGHVDYNQKIESGVRHPGVMDVHRLVTLFGYQFDRKTHFITEIEVEHGNEIFIEQAFIRHRIAKGINLKAGLLLIPMGMVNETHEPTFFYSVERPLLDKIIIPTTWREIGLGINGILTNSNLKYQLYLVNNPISYNGSPTLNGTNGFRKARQKGIKSLVTSFPGLTGQIEYYGLEGLKFGLSFYHGKTNSSLTGDYPIVSPESTEIIDSSTVLLSMAAFHSTFNKKQFTARFQYVLGGFGNSASYNEFLGTDVPELMHGYYLLFAYDLLKDEKRTLAPFARYSYINNHLQVNSNTLKNDALEQKVITVGLNYKPTPEIVFKVDYELYDITSSNNFQKFNTGIGVWF